mmetsp:Transcript_2515/g.4658  ORF Transcript_2515/g.4658 Transcript_2515/m.4658 type:complete len:105 (+) Transcript_2515:752-1066(+)
MIKTYVLFHSYVLYFAFFRSKRQISVFCCWIIFSDAAVVRNMKHEYLSVLPDYFSGRQCSQNRLYSMRQWGNGVLFGFCDDSVATTFCLLLVKNAALSSENDTQ